MKRITLTFLVLMAFGSLFAQTRTPEYPSYYAQFWNHGHHADNATITGELWIDDVLQEGMNWEIGAYDLDGEWAGEVVGGIVADIYASKPYPLYFLLYNGEPGDRIIFKLYDHLIGEETDYVCSFDTVFVVNGQLGIPSNPFQFRFYTVKDMVFEGIEDNLWSNPANWTSDGEPAGRLPLAVENVTISAPCTLDMNAEAASVTITSGNYLDCNTDFVLTSEITIKDGGQLFAPAGSTYAGTVEKTIQGYATSTYGNYYMISVPVADFNMETGFEAAGMLNGDYDLYFFTQNPDMAGEIDPEDGDTWWQGEWQNYKWYLNPDSELDATNFQDEDWYINDAYLYANSETTTLAFNGTFYSDNGQYTLKNSSDSEWPGYQMVGNPFPCNTTITKGNKIGGMYVMNEEGRADVIAIEDPIVAPATALLIQSAGGNPATQRRVTFVPTQEEATVRSMDPRVKIEVMANGRLEDRAYVRMYESENLSKFSMRNDGAKLFIPQNGKQYAAVYAGESKVMPVSFTTTENGTYTLSINTENMTCSYLHLIDNMTGADVDLLSTSTYTFEAKNTDYSSRFKLIFAEESTDEIAESFVYINNGNLIINNDGAAKLQLMDATGRILSAEDINGSYSKSLNLSAGVYIVRLLNGVDVKTQKIVVE